MSSMSKMHYTNSKCKDWLKKNNFSEIQMFPHGRWDSDVFGLFDAVCIRQVHGKFFSVFWLQFKTGKSSLKTRNAIKGWCSSSHQKAILLEYYKAQVHASIYPSAQ